MASQSVTGSIRHEIGALLASSHQQHLPRRMHPSLFNPNPSPSPILKFDRSRGHAAHTPAPAPVQLEDGANSREERRRRKRRKKKKSQKRNSKIPRKIWGIRQRLRLFAHSARQNGSVSRRPIKPHIDHCTCHAAQTAATAAHTLSGVWWRQ